MPYLLNGWDVILCDIKGASTELMTRTHVPGEGDFRVLNCDVRLVEAERLIGENICVILAAPPCTDFAGSGAQYWPEKDADGRTAEAISIADACRRIISVLQPDVWALENPVGRLRRYHGTYQYAFDPCDFGGYMKPNEQSHELAPPQDAYTKKTLLWGRFNEPEKKSVVPIRACSQGSWVQTLGGKSERTKMLRSTTPTGFARAFYAANH